jgi:hypothetical protein
LINAAVIQRNKDHAYGVGRGASSENDAASTPESTGDTSIPTTQSPAAQQSATVAPAAQPTAAQQATPQSPSTLPKRNTITQGRQAIDAAAAAVGNARSKNRAKLIDYAMDKFAAVERSAKPTPQTAAAASSIKTTGNVKSTKASVAATAKESVYIDSNVITEDIQFIDCSRF